MRFGVALIATILGIAVAACSSNGDDGPAESAPTQRAAVADDATLSEPAASPSEDTADLRLAVQDFAAALLTGEFDPVFAELSGLCQRNITVGDFDRLRRTADGHWGKSLRLSSFSADIDGDSALVSYSFSGAPSMGARAQKWYREDTGWHWDAC